MQCESYKTIYKSILNISHGYFERFLFIKFVFSIGFSCLHVKEYSLHVRKCMEEKNRLIVFFSPPGRRPWELMPRRSVRRSSVRCQLFPLNDFFSRTTWPISTKWGMGIQICSNKGSGPFWGPIRGKIRKILKNLKNLLMNNWPE